MRTSGHNWFFLLLSLFALIFKSNTQRLLPRGKLGPTDVMLFSLLSCAACYGMKSLSVAGPDNYQVSDAPDVNRGRPNSVSLTVLTMKVSPSIAHEGNVGDGIFSSQAQAYDNSQSAKVRDELLGNGKRVPVRVTVRSPAT